MNHNEKMNKYANYSLRLAVANRKMVYWDIMMLFKRETYYV